MPPGAGRPPGAGHPSGAGRPPGPDDRTKAVLRREFLRLRLGLGPAGEELGRRIQTALIEHDAFVRAGVILVYLPFRGEVPTAAVIEAGLARGKVVAAPLTLATERRLVPLALAGLPDELQPGTFGILEPRPERCPPVDPGRIDLVVVPGLAFDTHGARLGYGGGFYDRFLGRHVPQATRAGLAFEVQVVDRLPTDRHDAAMDLVFTEQRIIQGDAKHPERSNP